MHDLCYHPPGLYELENLVNNTKDYIDFSIQHSKDQYQYTAETLERVRDIIKNIPKEIVVKNVLKIP